MNITENMCPECGGTGKYYKTIYDAANNTNPYMCPTCHGTGKAVDNQKPAPELEKTLETGANTAKSSTLKALFDLALPPMTANKKGQLVWTSSERLQVIRLGKLLRNVESRENALKTELEAAKKPRVMKRATKDQHGWTVDFDLIRSVCAVQECNWAVGMEEAETVILALVKLGYLELAEPTPVLPDDKGVQ